MLLRRSAAGPSRRGEAGSLAAEQVAVLVMVAAVVAALVRISMPTVVGEWGSYAVCQLFGSGACEAPGSATLTALPPDLGIDDEAMLPSACLVHQTSEQAGYQVRVAFVRFGEDYGFLRQEYADGRVRLTVVNEAALGAEWRSGTRIIDLGRLGSDEKAGATVQVGGGLSFGYGDTWQFASAAEEQQMRQQLDDYLLQQLQIRNAGMEAVGLHLWWWLSDGYVDPPKDPSVTYSTIGLDGSLAAGVGLRSPMGVGDDGEERFLDPQVGARLQVDASYDVVVEHDHDTGRRSETYTLTGSGTAQADVTVGRGQISGDTTGSVKLTYDEHHQLVRMEFVSTRAGGIDGSLGGSNPVGDQGPTARVGTGGSTATVTRTVLDLDSVSDRAVATAWLSENNARFGTPLSLTYDQLVPDERVAGDAFQNLLYRHGRTSEVTYDDVDDVRRFGLDIKAGWQLGVEVHHGTGERTVREASYLGAPRHDGRRELVPDPTCG
jgi:hypothetical protein